MPNITINLNNEGPFISLTSLSQNFNTASKIDIVLPTSQTQDLQLPRIPGLGKEYIVHVAPDFDAPVEFGR